MKIATSILNMKKETKYLEKLENTNTDYLHLDIMDGKFVTNTSDLYDFIKNNEPINKELDVHLMVYDVNYYIEKYSNLNPEYITIHYEIDGDINEAIKLIKSKNCKVGLSIKPNTKVDEIIDYLDKIDLVLVMSVEPGYGGQSYIDVSDKLEQLRKLQNNYNFVIEVDGGIKDTTIKSIDTDIAVVGSFITSADNYQEQINKLKY